MSEPQLDPEMMTTRQLLAEIGARNPFSLQVYAAKSRLVLVATVKAYRRRAEADNE